MAATFPPGPVLVVGHRGNGRNPATENTLPSFTAALHAGATWVETDVRADATGTLVLHHDAHLPGGVGPRTPVAAADPGTLTTLHALHRHLPGNVGVLLEIKSDCTQPQPWTVTDTAVTDTRHWTRPTLLASFDPTVIARIRATSPDTPTGLLTRSGTPLTETIRVAANLTAGYAIAHAGQLTADLAELDPDTLAGITAVAATAHLHLWAWNVTVDHVPALLTVGVTGLVTDDVPGVHAAAAAHHTPAAP